MNRTPFRGFDLFATVAAVLSLCVTVSLLAFWVGYGYAKSQVPPPQPAPECVQEFWIDASPETSWLQIGDDTYCATHQTVWHRDNPPNEGTDESATGTGYFIWKLHFKMSSPPTDDDILHCKEE